VDDDILRKLEIRLGPLHARQRLGIERDHEAQVFGQGLTFFHLENSSWAEWIIRNVLKATGLYWRARKNAERILVKRNDMRFKTLPPLFEGFTILHISDLHVDMNEVAMNKLIELVGSMQYDVCVLTGDYRGRTFGPFQPALDGVARVGTHLKQPIYAVLGNHDTIQMVPGLEAMGIRVLLNECETIVRKDQRIYLAGIDDAHFFRVDNIEKAALSIPRGEFSILLSHTPEVYRQAAHADFDLMLRTHPWRSDLSPRIHSHQARGGAAKTDGGWALAVQRYDRLYFGWCGLERCSRAPQLPAGDYLASFTPWLTLA